MEVSWHSQSGQFAPCGRAINNGKDTTWAAGIFCMAWRRDQISASVGIEPTFLGQTARTLLTCTKFRVFSVQLNLTKRFVCFIRRNSQESIYRTVCGTLTELQAGQLRNCGLFAEGKVPGPSPETTESFAQDILLRRLSGQSLKLTTHLCLVLSSCTS